jgi:hypothetical protein
MSSLRRTATVVAVLVALLVPSAHAAPAPLAGGPPRADAPTPAATTASLLSATRSQKARTGLGLPHYRGLLGSKKWETAVKKADRAFTSKLAPPALGRIGAAQALDPNDPLSAKDSLKGKAGSQTRSLRIASSLDSGCPVYQSYGAFELKGKARGDYVVKTAERIGRYDVTTTVTFEVRFSPFSQIGRGSTVSGIGAHDGTVTVTRAQTARDRRTGKTRRTGPTQRLAEALSTLLVLDGDFGDFIAQQDRDERPAPRRPLRSAVWDDAAQRFVAVVYAEVEREFAAAERRMQTPNACTALSFTGPERLTPSQTTDITGIVRPAQGEAPPEELLEGLQILSAEYVNEQGQKIEQLGGNDDWKPGQPWYRFTAPPQAWPDSKPVGLYVKVATDAGVAEGEITFRAQDPKVYFRVLDGSVTSNWSASSTDHFCGRIAGSQRFGGSFAPRPFNPQNSMHNSQGRWLGFVEARINAAWTQHHVEGCKTNELGQRVPCAENLPDASPRPDGTWPYGFQIVQPAGSNELELRWRVVPATVGYIEPDEEECFVYLEGRAPAAKTTQRIPAERLLGGQPVTLTLSDSWSVTGIESFDYSWTYSITIQRVGADGNPL